MISLDAPTEELWHGPGLVPEGQSPAVATTARHCLLRHYYTTVRAVIRADAAELLEIRGFGVTCLAELSRVLAAHGRRLDASLTWREVAKQLADRMKAHAYCPQHPENASDPECPFCADRAAYAVYLDKASRRTAPVTAEQDAR
jgi:hypothetical protein